MKSPARICRSTIEYVGAIHESPADAAGIGQTPQKKNQPRNYHVIARSRQATWQSRRFSGAFRRPRDCHGLRPRNDGGCGSLVPLRRSAVVVPNCTAERSMPVPYIGKIPRFRGSGGFRNTCCREQLWLFRRTRLRYAESLGEKVSRYALRRKNPINDQLYRGTVITVPYIACIKF